MGQMTEHEVRSFNHERVWKAKVAEDKIKLQKFFARVNNGQHILRIIHGIPNEIPATNVYGVMPEFDPEFVSLDGEVHSVV